MKNLILISIGIIIAMMINTEVFSQSENTNPKTELKTFKVWGACGMCKSRIEKAALGVNGVKTAAWDKESNTLKVSINSGAKLEDVQKAVAKVGHDTENYKAEEKVYNNLPACCHYRK